MGLMDQRPSGLTNSDFAAKRQNSGLNGMATLPGETLRLVVSAQWGSECVLSVGVRFGKRGTQIMRRARGSACGARTRCAATPAGHLNLRDLAPCVWRKKWRVLIPTALSPCSPPSAVNAVTPRYKSEARVLVEARENVSCGRMPRDANERGTTIDQEAVTSQVQFILSRDLAREIITELQLAEQPEFDPLLAGSASGVRSRHAGIVKNPRDMTPEERVFKSYYERLSAFEVEKSRVIAIEFESGIPVSPRVSPMPSPRAISRSSRPPNRTSRARPHG